MGQQTSFHSDWYIQCRVGKHTMELPYALHGDHGSHFMSEAFQRVCKLCIEIKHINFQTAVCWAGWMFQCHLQGSWTLQLIACSYGLSVHKGNLKKCCCLQKGLNPTGTCTSSLIMKQAVEDWWMLLEPLLRALLAYLVLLKCTHNFTWGFTIVGIAMSRQNSTEFLLNPLWQICLQGGPNRVPTPQIGT